MTGGGFGGCTVTLLKQFRKSWTQSPKTSKEKLHSTSVPLPWGLDRWTFKAFYLIIKELDDYIK